MAGQAAVKATNDGETDKMVILVRGEEETYSCETDLPRCLKFKWVKNPCGLDI